MNILLWIFQTLFALHTLMGAIWKFSHSEQSVPSLSVIPHAVWMILSILEIICFLALILPAINKHLGIAAPIAAVFVVSEMLLYCVIHSFSGITEHNEIIYWLVVAAIGSFIAYGRFKLCPHKINGKQVEN